MKRAARIGAIIKILSDSPSKSFGLSYFCETLNAAKSSISEDIKIAKEISENIGIGKIVTTSGAGGGVKFIPDIKDKALASGTPPSCSTDNPWPVAPHPRAVADLNRPRPEAAR